ncbi:hypothetical protein EYF80_046690 [Liparis tanakae]|uniref:Uncharacterized protein n=1 Tax=Liparis tanakae TaxID=230148 RepID=A0A4Z2FPQ1_9TELE|nr:hypothetical protein EYF80_046690 [Liparis tanakae]
MLLERRSSGTMWAETRKYSVAAKRKQPSITAAPEASTDPNDNKGNQSVAFEVVGPIGSFVLEASGRQQKPISLPSRKRNVAC